MPHPLQSRVAPQAWPATIVLAVLAAGSAFLHPGLAAAVALLSGANLLFFRNPRRRPPEAERLVVSPAEGRVVEVARVTDPEGFVGPGWRIAIFLSIFSVHINCAPVSAKVRAVRRRGARFLAAFKRDASALIDLETPTGARLAVVQITGLVARRIVSYPKEGDMLRRAEPYGLICYGSRVEIYLPESSRPAVRVGDRVRGAASVLAELAS